MLITIVNSKGGTGKTTLSVHTAAWLQDQGLRVAVIDADEQGSATQWLRQAAPDLPVHPYTTALDILQQGPRLAAEYDAVVADGPAALGTKTAALASIADLAVMPIMPSMLDIWASYRTARLIYRVRFHPKRKGRPKALTVLNRALSRTRLARVALAAIRKYGFPVSPVVLEARTAYAEACEQGTVVWRMGRKACRAAAEMNRLFELMLETLPDCPAAAAVLARRRAAPPPTPVLAQAACDQQDVVAVPAAAPAPGPVLSPGPTSPAMRTDGTLRSPADAATAPPR